MRKLKVIDNEINIDFDNLRNVHQIIMKCRFWRVCPDYDGRKNVCICTRLNARDCENYRSYVKEIREAGVRQ